MVKLGNQTNLLENGGRGRWTSRAYITNSYPLKKWMGLEDEDSPFLLMLFVHYVHFSGFPFCNVQGGNSGLGMIGKFAQISIARLIFQIT